jgi:hypothetical protein
MTRYGAGSPGHPAGVVVRFRAMAVSEEYCHGLYHH